VSPTWLGNTTSWEAIAAAAPEIVVVAPCGYHLDGAVEQARHVAAALAGIETWAIDADALIVRPGPRLIDGVEALASIFHPAVVPAVASGSVQRVS
jgi:iron complex transport system substrate-binding protein